ncbi:hypothetical protein OQI_33235 [Streptomyces pharetrae CZA14]|uniref:Rieske domain-containing protein n=1 Tax=Streptomyces pharetrae CZA14 TaxID=1144883 RepID=A0ABX3YAA9_9ACTN|nr:hypothetical protein OQI_33235 [Streptomyces pharetrae CZA14]
MIVLVCAACSCPLTRTVQLSETLSRPSFDGRVGPDGARRAPATMPHGFYAVEPEPWDAPLVPIDDPVPVFPEGPCVGDPDGDGFLVSAGPRDTIVLHPDDAPRLLHAQVGEDQDPWQHVGCCGLHGRGGPNRLCPYGTPVGTETSDCSGAYELHLDPALVRLEHVGSGLPASGTT